MGNCCGAPKRDAVWVKQACAIRFPEIDNVETLLNLIRYCVGKTEVGLRGAPGAVKEGTALTVIDLLIEELASEEIQALYASLGGREFTKSVISVVCHAGRHGKALTSGV